MVDNVEDKKGNDTKHAFLVYLTDDPDTAAGELETLAEKHKIKNIPLTVFDGEAGPPRYKIAKEAEVTIMMWEGQKVKVNQVFASNALDKNGVKKVFESAKEHLKGATEEAQEQVN